MWMLSIIARSQKSSSRCRAALLPLSNEQRYHRGVMLQVALHMLNLRMSTASAGQKGPPSSRAASPPKRQHPFKSIPALTEIQTAEHHASHAQHRAELNGVESALDGSGSVQHSNCATSPRCNGSQPPQHEDTAGPPGESGGCHQQCEGRSAATRCLQQKPGTLAGCSRSPCNCSFSCAAPKQHSGPVGLPSLLREGKQCMERARGSDA